MPETLATLGRGLMRRCARAARLIVRHYTAVVALVAGLLVTGLAYRAAVQAETESLRAGAALAAEWRGAAIEKRLSGGLNAIAVLGAYFASQHEPSRDQFERLAAAARELGAPIGRLAWEPRIAGADRARFEAEAQASDYPGYGIREFDATGALVPAGERPEYFPMRYEALFGDFPSALGYDIASSDDRRRIMERARDFGEPQALQPRLQQAAIRARPAWLVYWPIYRDGVRPTTVAARQAALTGYVTAAIYVAETIEWATAGDADPDAELWFHVGEGASAVPIAALPRGMTKPVLAPEDQVPQGAITFARRFTLYGLPWSLVTVYPADRLAVHRTSTPISYLGLGFALTALITANAILLGRSRSQIADEVARRTIDLNAANARLLEEAETSQKAEENLRRVIEALPQGVLTVDRTGVAFATGRAVELLGWTRDTLIGRPMAEIVAPGHRDWHTTLARVFDAVPDADSPAKLVAPDASVTVITADRREIPVEMAATLIETRVGKQLVVSLLDIRERIAAEAALDASRARFRDFAAIASDCLWETDAALRLTFASGLLDDEATPSHQTWIGRPLSEVFHVRGSEAAFYEAITDRRAFRQVEASIDSVGGDERVVRISARPIAGPDGIFHGYRGVMSDVTDMVRAQRTAALAQARLQDAMQVFPALFMVFDPDEKLVLTNGTGSIWSWELGTPFEDMVRRALPAIADLGDPELWSSHCLAQFRSGNADFEIAFADGRWFRLLFRRTSDGGTLYIRIDVTEAKRREAELRLIAQENTLLSAAVQATDRGILISDERLPDSPVTFVNPAFTMITGYDRDEIVGRNCRLLQGPDTDKAALEAVSAAIASRRRVDVEFVNYRKSGERFWNALSLSPVIEPDGTLCAYIGIVNDVTGRRRLEEELRQAQRLETIGQLTGGIAHDFNNLLGVIIGNLELMGDDQATAEDRKLFLAPALRAARSAGELTQRLLTFSRRQTLRPVHIRLVTLVAELKPLLDRSLGARIRVETAIADQALACRADRVLLENAILNLAINARDAMPNGGSIRIDVERVAAQAAREVPGAGLDARDYVAISVADEGEGMDDAVRQRIFEPFFTTKGEGKGTGMGLSMVYGFAKQSQGHVTVESTVGVGTRITLLLPADSGPEPALLERADVDRPMRSRQVVLLVEDDQALRAVARRQLEAAGLVVRDAANAAEALRLLSGRDLVDLLITDVILPGDMDGLRLAETARSSRPGLPVAFVSGMAPAGADGSVLTLPGPLLRKPYGRADLLELVRKALGAPADAG